MKTVLWWIRYDFRLSDNQALSLPRRNTPPGASAQDRNVAATLPLQLHGGPTVVRRWVLELSQVPRQYIHEPRLMQTTLRQEIDRFIGEGYPAPILDHGWARECAIAFFGRHRELRRTVSQKEIQ